MYPRYRGGEGRFGSPPPRESVQLPPPREGNWGSFLAGLTFLAFVLLAAWLGVGVWRFAIEARDRGNKLDDLRRLSTDIDNLINEVLNVSIPSNCTFDPGNITEPNRYPDDEFLLFDDLDPTAQMQYNASQLSLGQTVLLTSQNVSGTVAYLFNIEEQTATFQDDTFAVINDPDNTKVVMLDVSVVSAGFTRIMSVQNVSGVIAYLSDIPTFPSVFLDSEFTVVNAADNSKRVMLNCSGIGSGVTRIMTVQNKNGIIAYLSDLVNATGPPFADTDFRVFADGDPSADTRLDLSLVSTSTFVVMTVQDRSGTIAYLSDVVQIIEVVINQTRTFPDVANEGVATLAGLGDLTHLELTFCGGGGGACIGTSDGSGGGGGGAGATVQDFIILDPTSKFTRFNISLGAGGLSNATDCRDTQAGAGGTTSVVGDSAAGFYFELSAFGGAGGFGAGFAANATITGAGGGGGGHGGQGIGTAGGASGGLGGLSGTRGFVFADTCDAFRQPGIFKFPWYSGGGGFAINSFCVTPVEFGVQSGGFYDNDDFLGAPSIFGRTNTRTDDDVARCAGATERNFFMGTPTNGGAGQAIVRYFVR